MCVREREREGERGGEKEKENLYVKNYGMCVTKFHDMAKT